MTEINIYSAGDNSKKTQSKQQTRQAANELPEIAIFGGKAEGSGTPFKPAEKKLPSIFDDNSYKAPELPKTPKKSMPKVPFIDSKMRQEYTERTTVGIFKGLIQQRPTKANTEKLVQEIHGLDPQSYKFAFQSFTASGLNLPDMVMNSKHLSEAQKKQCLDHMVKVGKDVANYGNQRSDDVIPKMQDLVKKYDTKTGLNENDKKRLSADFKKIVNRSDTLTTKKPERPNGKIDRNFKQGQTGDCWLLAGIKSLSMTPQGKAVLDKSITVDEKGNATVNLRGVGKTYTITARDLKGSNELSSGDADVRALEIAMDRYFREELPEGSADIDGNRVGKALELLGDPGKTTSGYRMRGSVMGVDPKDIMEYIKDNGMAGHAAIAGMTPDVDTRGMGATDTRTGEKVDIYTSHAYSIKEIKDGQVYLVNPHNTRNTIKMPYQSFASKFNMIALSDVRGLK